VQLLSNAERVIINTHRPASFVFPFIVFQWKMEQQPARTNELLNLVLA
jgi:hypothetical protein